MDICINSVTLVMYWTRLLRVCKVGRLHVTRDILLGLRSSVGQLLWSHVSQTRPCSSTLADYPWIAQIADLNVSVFAHIFRSPIWRCQFLFKILGSAI